MSHISKMFSQIPGDKVLYFTFGLLIVELSAIMLASFFGTPKIVAVLDSFVIALICGVFKDASDSKATNNDFDWNDVIAMSVGAFLGAFCLLFFTLI